MTSDNLVEWRLKQLEDGQKAQDEALGRIEEKLSKIETELLSYQRVGKILLGIAGAVGMILGWIAKVWRG